MRNFKRMSDRSEAAAAIRPIGPIRKTIPVMRSIKIAIKRIRRTFDAWVAKQPILKSTKELSLGEELYALLDSEKLHKQAENVAKEINSALSDLASLVAEAKSETCGVIVW